MSRSVDLLALMALVLVVVCNVASGGVAQSTYTLTTFALNDTRCLLDSTGSVTNFATNSCIIAPTSAVPYHSFEMQTSGESGNFTLDLYIESSECDDFPGYYNAGSIGDEPTDCQLTPYFAFQITMDKETAARNGKEAKLSLF